MVMDLDNAAQGIEIAVKAVMKLLLREIHCGWRVDLAQEFPLSLFVFLNFNISLLKRCLCCCRLACSYRHKQTRQKGCAEERC